MLNEESIATYRQAKAGTATLNEKLADKRQAVADVQRRIAGHRQRMGEIGELLRKEDLALNSPSRLHQPALTHEEYEGLKQEAAELEQQFPGLQSKIDQANREIARLELELRNLHGAMKVAQEQIAARMVEQSAAQLIETAGDQFKNLVMALIAKQGKQQGFALTAREAFEKEISRLVCATLYPGVFGDGEHYSVPDLCDANQHIVTMIEGTA